ncbi:hypothetical protein LCGC14_0417050 [marine sediment metagenome]|uniref:Uncharacterized protein n=1 Tax=marine sediment metagenome TaxID=412755 RepID=A0A0F9VE68_9ZZZZ
MGASQDIAKALLKLYPDKCKIVEIKLLHTKVTRKFIMGIEEAHHRAAKSKLRFKEVKL